MNKEQLIRVVAKKLSSSITDTRIYVNTILDTIEETILNDEEVMLTGFGTFRKAEVKARIGTDPRTQEKIEIETTWIPKFKVGDTFQRKIKKSPPSNTVD